MGSPGAGSGGGHECSFKILLIGDSAVGKSSLLVSFVAAAAPLDEDIAPTIGTSHTPPLLDQSSALPTYVRAPCVARTRRTLFRSPIRPRNSLLLRLERGSQSQRTLVVVGSAPHFPRVLRCI
jgi:GTPase SAR1 family protein